MIFTRKVPRFSPSFSPAEVRAIGEYLLSGQDGEEVKAEFESAFAAYIGAGRAIMVPSARMGLHLLLKHLGLKEGDEVLLPAFHYFSIPSIIHAMRLRPSFVDISRETLLIDPARIEGALSGKTRAIIPTHLYGSPCPMDEIMDVAKRRGLTVIEDCAQAVGAAYEGKKVGSFGSAAYYTFGLTKNMTTLRGGMITLSDEEAAGRIQDEILSHERLKVTPLIKDVVTGLLMTGLTRGYFYPFTLFPLTVLMNLGRSDRLHDFFKEKEVLYDEIPVTFAKSKPRGIQAGVGLSQLKRIDALNNLRTRNGKFLFENLKNVPSLEVPRVVEKGESVYMSFPVLSKDPSSLKARLLKRGIDTDRGYMRDFSSHPFFKREGPPCSVSKMVEKRLLHIPVHPNLTERDLIHICESVRRAIFEE